MWFRRRSPVETEALRTSLRDAAAWCAPLVGGDADARLWTPGLLDLDVAADEDALWKTFADAPAATVETLVARRAERLTRRPAADREPLDGRVLVCEYNCTLFDGASRAAAPGFIDLWDIPAWDTWIGLLPSGYLRAPGADRLPALLTWMPAALVPRAQGAIEVNPCEVLSWLDTREPRLARALTRPD